MMTQLGGEGVVIVRRRHPSSIIRRSVVQLDKIAQQLHRSNEHCTISTSEIMWVTMLHVGKYF